ncbi:POTRA domain-containing protein [Bryobacter aggregatus]|uniref:POTRA domain-containing protein n=1 Tax=Bryobacter aggregatus TaxID=360054 RepID=UPI00138DF1F4|nr:POTRA domain-containing protein [Bryobacter aggregatus]
MNSRISFGVVFLSLGAVLFAQAPDQAFPVRAVAVQGNRILQAEQVIAAAGILPGSTVKPAQMDAAMQKLLTCGYFDKVAYDYKPQDQGYALTWDITEVSTFYPIGFEEIPAKIADVKAILKKFDPLFGDKIPATQEVLSRYEEELNRALKLTDPVDRVRGQLATDAQGNLVAMFRPKRELPTISSVDFSGNRLLSLDDLRPLMASAAVGLVYREPEFRDILDIKIRPMYEARGHVKVTFPEITATPAKENAGLNLKVKIVEGEEYKLGEIRVEGEAERTDDWLRVGGFRQGVTANMGEVDEGRRKMEAAIKRNGFLDAKVTGKRTINEERKVVDMDFKIDAGGKYQFDRLEIKGLDLISEPEVRKMWGVKAGSPFNPEYPDFFLNKLREDGVFDNLGETKSIADVDRVNHTVAVTLVFKGAPPVDPNKTQKRPGPRL